MPYCVPYWSPSTYRAILRCVVAGAASEGRDVARLANRIARLLGLPGVVPCGSGRAAIELALRALGLREGTEVVVPTFCCASVIPPILAIGAVPRLADVGEELNLVPSTVEPVLSERTRAVIVPHLFGNPAEIEAIVELCRGRGIAVIDDAAQALGATLGGRPLGSFGDAGIVSFGNGKVCFGTGGGVLVSSRPEIREAARQVLLARGTAAEGIRNALAVLVWRRWRRWSLPAWRVLSRVRGLKTERRPYRRSAMRNVDAAVAVTLLETLAFNVRARRERAALYQELLRGAPGVRVIPHREGSACLTQVIALDPDGTAGTTVPGVIGALRAGGVEVNASYTPLHLLPEFQQFGGRELDHAARVWSRLVELPCEPSVQLDDVRRVTMIVRQVVTGSRDAATVGRGGS